MKLGLEKQRELLVFLNDKCFDYIRSKNLTPKNKILIQEFTEYLKHKVDGKTTTQRVNEILNKLNMNLTL